MTTALPIQPTTSARYRTAAEWLHDLGDVPLERIIFDPWPGTATEADLLRKAEVEKQLCELIYGTLVEKPAGFLDSMIAVRLSTAILNFVQPRRLGIVAGEAGMMRLTRGLVRMPDACFVSYAHLPGGKAPHEPIPSLAPDLAVEILSKTNTPREMERKLREYFDAGVRCVWIIDPAGRSARTYTSPQEFSEISIDGSLVGTGSLNGFEMCLRDLLDREDAPQAHD